MIARRMGHSQSRSTSSVRIATRGSRQPSVDLEPARCATGQPRAAHATDELETMQPATNCAKPSGCPRQDAGGACDPVAAARPKDGLWFGNRLWSWELVRLHDLYCFLILRIPLSHRSRCMPVVCLLLHYTNHACGNQTAQPTFPHATGR